MSRFSSHLTKGLKNLVHASVRHWASWVVTVLWLLKVEFRDHFHRASCRELKCDWNKRWICKWVDLACLMGASLTTQIDAARGPGPKCLDDYRRQLVNGSGSLAQSSMSTCLEAGSRFVLDLDWDYDFESFQATFLDTGSNFDWGGCLEISHGWRMSWPKCLPTQPPDA